MAGAFSVGFLGLVAIERKSEPECAQLPFPAYEGNQSGVSERFRPLPWSGLKQVLFPGGHKKRSSHKCDDLKVAGPAGRCLPHLFGQSAAAREVLPFHISSPCGGTYDSKIAD